MMLVLKIAFWLAVYVLIVSLFLKSWSKLLGGENGRQ